MTEVGDRAPEIDLPGTRGEEIREHHLREHTDHGPVVLAFYLFDFHPQCTEQVCSMRDLNWLDVRADTRVLAVSTDSVFSHRAFAAEHNLDYALLSDSDGAVSESYGVLYDELGGHKRVSKRAVFLIDEFQTVRYRWMADDPSEPPPWDEVTNALDELSLS